MKSCYYVRVNGLCAVLDCCDYYGEGRIITRINVPEKLRGQGIGRKLLLNCIFDADKEGVTLWLEINPYGQLSYSELESWYLRHGFKNLGGIYRRKPMERAK